MDNTSGGNDGVFSKLNGAASQALVVIGLVFVLAAPLIPSFKAARVARAQTELSQVDTLTELDLDDLKRSQDRERKEDVAAAERDQAPLNYALGPVEVQKQQQERQSRETARQAREKERQKVFDDKKDELKKKYDSNERRRELIDAQVAFSGMRWHLVLSFLGNAMLLIGLLVLTLESVGVRQKIALVILLVVMFSALSGVSINFLASGGLGEHSGSVMKQP
jgi:flagellar motor protein MotB